LHDVRVNRFEVAQAEPGLHGQQEERDQFTRGHLPFLVHLIALPQHNNDHDPRKCDEEAHQEGC